MIWLNVLIAVWILVECWVLFRLLYPAIGKNSKTHCWEKYPNATPRHFDWQGWRCSRCFMVCFVDKGFCNLFIGPPQYTRTSCNEQIMKRVLK